MKELEKEMGKDKGKVPTIDAFFDEAAVDYATARWMQRIQRATTARAVQLLDDGRAGGTPMDRGHALVLDAGCGNGFSSLVLREHGFRAIVGVDISPDMLAMHGGGHVVLGDIARLPFRPGAFDALVSISAMNFVSRDATDDALPALYTSIARDVHDMLVPGGRAVIEFYPRSPRELAAITAAFGTSTSGLDAFLVVDKPGTRKEQKYLLLVRPPVRHGLITPVVNEP